MKYENLLSSIDETHQTLQQSAVKAVNSHITLRNWLIGYYIVEFEQNGEDRAQYGARLFQNLAKELKSRNIKTNERDLRGYRNFYATYLLFVDFICYLPAYRQLAKNSLSIRGALTSKSQIPILGSVTQKSKKPIRGSVTPELQQSEIKEDETYYTQIFTQISYTHFVELIKIKEPTKRKFYELSIIKNTLSVRELERQIATLTYERVGLSANTDLAFQELKNKVIPETTDDAIKSIYFFDFLNLPNTHLVQESQLEEALINHLEKFIIELGNGFCFEARQKRILIDDEYCFVDLVFYHRLLKCHILIELKVDKFKHEHLSQLNSYVGCYNDQVKQIDDNPTIGILLCTEKGNKMVEYALAGMEEKLFVSKYLVQLPQKEQLIQFIENELKKT
jgi:predicted nuclease of restriction endonuclease-like (RecB) superfamily